MKDKFSVGQRVRNLMTPTKPEGVPVGVRGTIISPRYLGLPKGEQVRGLYYVVRFDGYQSDYHGNGWDGAYSRLECEVAPIPDDEAFKRFMTHTLEPLKVTVPC